MHILAVHAYPYGACISLRCMHILTVHAYRTPRAHLPCACISHGHGTYMHASLTVTVHTCMHLLATHPLGGHASATAGSQGCLVVWRKDPIRREQQRDSNHQARAWGCDRGVLDGAAVVRPGNCPLGQHALIWQVASILPSYGRWPASCPHMAGGQHPALIWQVASILPSYGRWSIC